MSEIDFRSQIRVYNYQRTPLCELYAFPKQYSEWNASFYPWRVFKPLVTTPWLSFCILFHWRPQHTELWSCVLHPGLQFPSCNILHTRGSQLSKQTWDPGPVALDNCSVIKVLLNEVAPFKCCINRINSCSLKDKYMAWVWGSQRCSMVKVFFALENVSLRRFVGRGG